MFNEFINNIMTETQGDQPHYKTIKQFQTEPIEI